MAEYIEREALIKKLKDKIINPQTSFINNVLIGLLEKALAADVVEVVYGEWVRPTIINGRTFDIPHCSVCDDVPCDTKNYCPNCGAKMT